MPQVKLNCDLGESFGAYRMGRDKQVMPLIEMANIACGMHASDPVTLRNTVQLAVAHNIEIGAHPGYPDKEGFGRRAMALSGSEVEALVLYQIAALDGVCRTEGSQVSYVKPHGALYHAMMQEPEVRQAIFKAVSDYWSKPDLVVLASEQNQKLQEEANNYALTLRFEAFADRAYNEDGSLLSRAEKDAVHHEQAKVLAQAEQIATQGRVTSISGRTIELAASTLCVHGDNEVALEAVRAIKAMLQKRQDS
ncbi:hypothetical protein CWE09_04060 [Aliidiomarina minuta]|uniref:LamB/YcsF family protein n=1 Tax=Aliidiomarina minuta TaxID=880057 RepID=A0A432W7C9_9GAMM|nr:5-oxoprolinase subunit PxpA [Aliidiomarina minuta]RUO25909.1 hypothetical protein CWE09_04060 [Aliidiomarina minuta]